MSEQDLSEKEKLSIVRKRLAEHDRKESEGLHGPFYDLIRYGIILLVAVIILSSLSSAIYVIKFLLTSYSAASYFFLAAVFIQSTASLLMIIPLMAFAHSRSELANSATILTVSATSMLMLSLYFMITFQYKNQSFLNACWSEPVCSSFTYCLCAIACWALIRMLISLKKSHDLCSILIILLVAIHMTGLGVCIMFFNDLISQLR